MSKGKRIGELLVDAGVVTPLQIDMALAQQKRKGGKLASVIMQLGLAEEDELLRLLSEQAGVPALDLSRSIVPTAPLKSMPRQVAEQTLMLLVGEREGGLEVAMADPNAPGALDELQFVTGKRIHPYVVLESTLRKVISDAYRLAEGSAAPPFWRGAAVTIPKGSEPPTGHLELLHAQQLPEAEVIDLVEESDLVELDDADLVPMEDEATPVGGPYVLVVDDEPDIRTLLTTALQKRGLRVEALERGDEVLPHVKAHPPKLILLDAMLPGVHGFEICRKLKSSPTYKAIPVVMVSAVYRGWRIAQDARQAYGADDYIEKPFKLTRLLGRVEELLASAGTGLEVERQVEAAQTAFRLGIEHYQAKAYPEAETALHEATKLDPLHVQAHQALGNVLVIQGRGFEAMQIYEEALELEPRLFAVLKNLALLYQRHGFRNKAAEMFERALEASPNEAARVQIAAELAKLED